MARRPGTRMHSVEHILNQTMDRLYGCGRCFSAHINSKKSKCDYHFDRALTEAEIADIQSRVNRIIDADLPVKATFVSQDAANQHYDTTKIPDTVTGKVRIVHIGDYDACPCVGEHVSSTGRIGAFRITTTSYAGGHLRIRFKLSAAST